MYLIKTSSAQMPQSCWGHYRRIGLLEIEDGYALGDVHEISTRPRAVKRVIQTWEKLNLGSTERCAYRRALEEAMNVLRDMTGEDDLIEVALDKWRPYSVMVLTEKNWNGEPNLRDELAWSQERF